MIIDLCISCHKSYNIETVSVSHAQIGVDKHWLPSGELISRFVRLIGKDNRPAILLMLIG